MTHAKGVVKVTSTLFIIHIRPRMAVRIRAYEIAAEGREIFFQKGNALRTRNRLCLSFGLQSGPEGYQISALRQASRSGGRWPFAKSGHFCSMFFAGIGNAIGDHVGDVEGRCWNGI